MKLLKINIWPYLFFIMVGFAAGFFVHGKYVCKGQTISIGKIKSKGKSAQDFGINQRPEE